MKTNILEYLEATAARLPEAVAFADEQQERSFTALLDEARALGWMLQQTVGACRRPVAVLSRRSVSCLVGFFGALCAGGCYVPLDAVMPQQRLAAILEKLRPAAILYSARDKALAESLSSHAPVFPIDTPYPAADEAGLRAIRKTLTDLDPAYILFTSGSTGLPKGIAVCHRSWIDFTEWYAGLTGVDETDCMGNQAPFFFDVSLRDISLTLKTGAQTFLLPQKVFSFPLLLTKALNDRHVTTLNWAAAAFHLIAGSGLLEKDPPKYLKRVLVGGEAMQAKLLRRWRRALPDVFYVNLYGPSETTVDSTYYPIDRDFSDDEPIPIGTACENMEVFLLNERDERCAVGEPGELCVRGTGLALGYYGEPEKTAAAFTQNPLNPAYPDRIYRTGDVAVLREDGLFVFLCRKDSQIKHNGYRIELGEIETALLAVAEVEVAACLFDSEGDRIVAFYSGGIGEAQLRQALRERLPKYMLPELLFPLQTFPRLPNGKLDRVRLKTDYLPVATRRNEDPL